MNSNPGLYLPHLEHDACGVGFVASIDAIHSNKVREWFLLIENFHGVLDFIEINVKQTKEIKLEILQVNIYHCRIIIFELLQSQ